MKLPESSFYFREVPTGTNFPRTNRITFHKSKYGFANAWRWNFGDETTLADTSHNKTPSWKFSTKGTKTAELIVQSNKGCIDTVSVQFEVKDKPTIELPFRDTLICSNLPIQDTLMLQAIGLGNFSWTPLSRILNENTATPLVFPTNTTVYQVPRLASAGFIGLSARFP